MLFIPPLDEACSQVQGEAHMHWIVTYEMENTWQKQLLHFISVVTLHEILVVTVLLLQLLQVRAIHSSSQSMPLCKLLVAVIKCSCLLSWVIARD